MNRRLAVCLVCALTIACGSSETPAPPSSRPALRPLSLPDTSHSADAVQTTLRDRFASLSKAIDDPSTPATALATAYGDMGKLFVAAEYFDAAETCFANARTLAPGDMRWPYYLGHVFRLNADPTRAVQSFEQALQLQPTHVPTLVWLAEMHLAANRPDAAEPLLIKAQSLDPKSGAVHYGLGRAALAKQDYAQAARQLEDALALAPMATRLHYPLAMAYRGLGKRAQADEHLRRRGEVDLPPSDPLLDEIAGLLQNAAAYETRGVKALEARQWSEAASNLRKAAELTPDNAYVHLNLGTALYMSGEADEASNEYRAAIRLSPDLARAHFGLGVVMETRGHDREAIDAFAAAVMHDPAYVEARFSLANALRRSGQVRESLAQYQEVLRLNPAVSQASFGYAMGLVRLGRYQEARDRLEKDVKAFPDQPGLAHALARLLAAAPDDRVRDGARALAIVGQLLRTQVTIPLAETNAMALAEVGRFDEAVSWQRQAIDAARSAGRSELGPRLTENLRRYQNKQPCRTPWADDDPVHHPQPSAQ